MNVISIEETGMISGMEPKESNRLKEEVFNGCTERIKAFLSPEQLEKFADTFSEVTEGYIFKKSE